MSPTPAANDSPLSVRGVLILTWVLLAGLTLGGWLVGSTLVGLSILVGGLVANLSFLLLKRDLERILAGPLGAAKLAYFVRYYARLAAIAILLFVLIRQGAVHVYGLLVGLSTVVLAITAASLQAARRVYLNTREA
ncbi:MAG: ATP synthase subunit I [Thermodesulfobacteriota bacterium]